MAAKLPLEPAAGRIAAGLGRLALALKAKAWRGAADAGITPTQGELLSRLAESEGGMRLGDIARELGISAPTASDAIATLVSKSLVEKQQGADKRSVTLRVSRKGRGIAARAGDWTSFLAESLATLTPAEQAAFLQSLMKVVRNMQLRGDISPQRMCLTCSHFRAFVHANAVKPHHCAFIDSAFGPVALRLNCSDHLEAEGEQQKTAWETFLAAS